MDNLENRDIELQLDKAKKAVAEVCLPPEIESLTVSLGPDSIGLPSLWLQLHVKKEVQRLTQFAREVQSAIIDKGITLFPYTSLEQAA